MKRGSVEVAIVLLVLAVSAFGLWFALGTGAGKAISIQSPVVDSPYSNCEYNCYSQFSGSQLSSCLGGCVTLASPAISETYAENPTGRYWNVIKPYEGGSESPMDACRRSCLTYVVGDALPDCMRQCDMLSPTGNTYAKEVPLTGSFVVKPAEYGGAIRGVAVDGTRAFPAGRAYEMPEQYCYTCSCLSQKITAVDKESAGRVCSENCGGVITASTSGACLI